MLEIPDSAYHKWTYSLNVLNMAYDIYRHTNVMILNPLDIHGTSLLNIDIDWWNDFNRYLTLVRYYTDERKRPRNLL